MATVVTLQASDLITNSRADINTSIANLNSDKIETSYLDTDTSLSNNSDVKIPSQKAVKTYIDTSGGANASETVRGIVEEATDAEVTAGTATGATGAKLIVTPTKLATRLSSLLKFGGTGADGALAITSGATNIDCANAAVVVKNYTSISITGTASLTFTNPHTNGTTIILKSQGNVTITSSTAGAIDATSMGASSASKGNSSVGIGTNYGGNGTAANPGSGGAGGALLGVDIIPLKNIFIACGAGGGSGATGSQADSTGGGGGGGGGSLINTGSSGSTGTIGGNQNGDGGAGGKGGGVLWIECAGALNITSTIYAKGGAGVDATGTSSNGGGGGGGGGAIVILYNTLTANSGTYTTTGGAGGAKTVNGGVGGAGATGDYLVALNTEFV